MIEVAIADTVGECARSGLRARRRLGRRSEAVAAALIAVVTACSSKPAPTATPHAVPAASHSCTAAIVRTVRLADHGAPGGSRYAQVFTPAGVADVNKLPVLYFLHGFPGGGDNIGHGPTAANFNAQICAGAAPFILVAPDGNAVPHADTEWADAADGRFDVESWVTGPLIDAVEGAHRRPAGLRAIAGFLWVGLDRRTWRCDTLACTANSYQSPDTSRLTTQAGPSEGLGPVQPSWPDSPTSPSC